VAALAAAGLEEGLVLARGDVLRGVRWHPPAGCDVDDELEKPRFVEQAEIPTAAAVAELARAAAERSGVWWRELEVLTPIRPAPSVPKR